MPEHEEKMKLNLDQIEKSLVEVKEASLKRFKAELVGIFGSYANGTQKESSDLDILVRFEESATMIDFVGLSDFLEEKLRVKVDIVPVDTLREEIRSDILQEAVYL